MPTFIKTGFWQRLKNAPKGFLNLEDLILREVQTIVTEEVSYSSEISEGTSYLPLYQEVLDYAANNSITIPSDSENAAMNSLIYNLTDYISSMETGNIYRFGSKEFGTINLADVDTFRHTISGNVTFTPDMGVKSTGGYINTQYAVNQRVGIENAFTVIVYISGESTEVNASKIVYGTRAMSNNSSIQKRITPLNISNFGNRHGYATNDGFANTQHKGLYILVGNGTQVIMYKDYDGVTGIKDTQTVTPTAPNIANPELLLAHNNSTAGGVSAISHYDNDVMALFRFDYAFDDADVIDFKSKWDDFLLRS